jgi:uncharacterized protein YjbI with pentapeptide repeats
MHIPRPTYGSVTATIALFAALAGTSYAAINISGSNIRNGTLTGADLKNESVKGSDIDNGSLTGSDLKNGSVTSSDIGDGSLLASDFKPGELPAGPAGPAGPQGPGGLADVVVRRADVTIDPQTVAQGAASCANGEIAVGGGASHSGTVLENVPIVYSAPETASGSPPQDGDTAARWVAGAKNNVSATKTLTVYVLCTRP